MEVKKTENNFQSDSTSASKSKEISSVAAEGEPKTQLAQNDKVNISDLKLNLSRFSDSSVINNVLTGTKLLRVGSKGDDVKLVQNSLKDMGFFPGDKTDGKFSTQTCAAVKNFQSSRNLKKTGIVDQKTMEEIIKLAPPPDKKLWDKGVLDGIFDIAKDSEIVPSNELKNGKRAKVVIDLSEHRLFLFNNDNSVKKIYSIASGNDKTPDGKGVLTSPGIKVVNGKNDNPKEVANKLWPETKGRAFGTKLIDLSWIDLDTGKVKANGEELHGTYVRSSIGNNASHGCMRMLNEDVEEIFKQLNKGDLVKVQE